MEGDTLIPNASGADAASSSSSNGGRRSLSTSLRSLNDLVLWADLKRSAIVFVSGNLFFLLMLRHEYSLVQLLAYVALLLLVAAVLFRVLANTFNTDAPRALYRETEFVSVSAAESFARAITPYINAVLNFAYKVLMLADRELTMHVSLALIFFAILGSFLSTLALLYCVFITVFVWPTVYGRFHAEIDSLVSLARAQLTQLVQRIVASVPRHQTRRSHSE